MCKTDRAGSERADAAVSIRPIRVVLGRRPERAPLAYWRFLVDGNSSTYLAALMAIAGWFFCCVLLLVTGKQFFVRRITSLPIHPGLIFLLLYVSFAPYWVIVRRTKQRFAAGWPTLSRVGSRRWALRRCQLWATRQSRASASRREKRRRTLDSRSA